MTEKFDRDLVAQVQRGTTVPAVAAALGFVGAAIVVAIDRLYGANGLTPAAWLAVVMVVGVSAPWLAVLAVTRQGLLRWAGDEQQRRQEERAP